MQFNFQYVLDLQPSWMSTVQFAHEPNGELVQYYIDGMSANNRSAKITNGNYSGVIFKEERPRLTFNAVKRIGIKSLTDIGAYGFYIDSNGEYAFVRVPINYAGGSEPPDLAVNQTDTTITYTLSNPSIITYETFRLIFRQDEWAYEFITMDLEGEFEKPFDMEGDFIVTCIGYRKEIQEYSEPTEPIEFSVTARV